jgi:ATP-binding cassette subfamily B protein
MAIYRRTLRYYRPFLRDTIVALALSIIGIGVNLLKPWPIKYLLDHVLVNPGGTDAAQQSTKDLPAFLAPAFEQLGALDLVLFLTLGLVAIHLLWGFLNLLTNYLFVRAGLAALLKLRTDLYACLQSLPLRFHDARRSTDSSFRVAYDSQSIQTIYNKGFTGVFSSVLMLVGTFVIMIRMDVILTLVSLSILPLIVWSIRYFAIKIREQSTTIQERESDVLTVAQEGLSSIKMVHAFAREEHEVSQFQNSARQSMEANLRLTTTSVGSSLVVGTLMAIGTALMYYVGARHVLDGPLSVGDLIVFATYLTMLYAPLESLTYTAWALQGAAAGAQRCFEVLDREDDVADAPDAKLLPPVKGAIQFENITFSYDGSRSILEDINLRIEPGTTVALVGGTGTGKSTLMSLVPRFYDPNRGRVLVDGIDIKTVTKRSLRNQIGMVLQDTLLFSTTIRENIAYGRPDATEEEIIEASKKAQAHEFIMAMPGGYRSQVGERGGHLSVGQRQRIGIARAFLKNAPILLLDEPTSALDPATEAAIMETIRELMRGRTTLIVTHRLSTIHGMDKIAVLKDSHLVEEGTGSELLARNGVYAALYRSGNYNP